MIEPVTLTAGDGCVLHGVRQPAGTPGAPVVLVVHSANQTHRAMLPLAARLAARAEVVLPDLRGFGDSVCRDPAAHTWDRLAADTREWVAAIRERTGGPVLLAGFALGAGVAVRAAAGAEAQAGQHAAPAGADAAGADALAVISPHHVPGEPVDQAVAARNRGLADLIERDGRDAVLEPWLTSLPPHLAEPLRRDIGLTDQASLIASFRGLAATSPVIDADVVRRAGRAMPRLLVVAGDDPSHPAEVGARYAELFAEVAAPTLSGALAGVRQPSAERWAEAIAEPLLALLEQ